MEIIVGSVTHKISDELLGGGSGISIFSLNNRNNLELRHVEKMFNPTYLALSDCRQFLYAIEERDQDDFPKVVAYRFQETSRNLKIIKVNEQLIPGAFACHIAVYGGQLLVSCYGSGNLINFALSPNGSIGSHLQVLNHEGTGPNRSRQEASHIHMFKKVQENLFYAVDLGSDKCYAYRFNSKGKLETVPDMDITLEPGSGPRHIQPHPSLKIVYVLCELSGVVVVFDIGYGKRLKLQSHSSLPKGSTGEASSAAIKMTQDGKFLLVSNRKCNTLSVFKVDDKGLLTLNQITNLKDITPRDFSFDEDQNFILIGGQDSNTLSLYTWDSKIGTLQFSWSANDIMRPSCILTR